MALWCQTAEDVETEQNLVLSPAGDCYDSRLNLHGLCYSCCSHGGGGAQRLDGHGYTRIEIIVVGKHIATYTVP